jgi:hypothetical protein
MMKILLLVFLTSVAFLSSAVGQERTDERKWTINPETGDTVYTEAITISKTEDITSRNSILIINPLKFFLFYNISYFHKLSDAAAIGVGIQTPTISGLSGFGANAELRFYPKGRNLKGFYFAPNFSFNSLTDKDDNETVSISSLGILIGWQWFPGEDFALGLGIGVDHYFFKGLDSDFESLNGFVPSLRFDIGFAW